uniref:Uncharacterized protein n=1 Tax=Aegilops tauschii subsp. strangulata TaxID=200361 RepID=A0A453BCF3_AEGTS
MMKWTHAAGAAETLCEPWVLHRFVRACPWSHEHLSRARRAASVGSRRSTIVGSAAANEAQKDTVVTNGDDDDEDWPSIWDSGCVELEMKIGHSIHDHCSPLLFVETISVFFINDL